MSAKASADPAIFSASISAASFADCTIVAASSVCTGNGCPSFA